MEDFCIESLSHMLIPFKINYILKHKVCSLHGNHLYFPVGSIFPKSAYFLYQTFYAIVKVK